MTLLTLGLGMGTGVFLARLRSAKETVGDVSDFASLRPSALSAVSAGGRTGPPPGIPTPLREALDFERELAALPAEAFPDFMDRELRDATGHDRVSRIATVWAEIDPEGFFAWLRARPPAILLGEAAYGVGLDSTLLAVLARDDPERAWKAAGELPGKPDGRYWTIVHDLLRREPGAAVILVRNHRDVISLTETWESWGRYGPKTALPILDALLPGPARATLIRDSARYYLEHPDELSEAGEWFEALPPDLRKPAQAVLDEWSPFEQPKPGHVTALREAWSVSGDK